METWQAAVEAFAKQHGYRLMKDLAFCEVYAPFGRTEVKLWISVMGGGGARATLAGLANEVGNVHCKARAKLLAPGPVEVHRRGLLDRIASRGVRVGDDAFDDKYTARGRPEHVLSVLRGKAITAFARMWERSEGLCVEDGDVVLEGGEFRLDPADFSFIIDAVGTIATSADG